MLTFNADLVRQLAGAKVKAPECPSQTISGIPMDGFNAIWIVRNDGSRHHFNSSVKGFALVGGESAEAAMLRAAKEVFPDTAFLMTNSDWPKPDPNIQQSPSRCHRQPASNLKTVELVDFEKISKAVEQADKAAADLVRAKVAELNEAIAAAEKEGVKTTLDTEPCYNLQTGQTFYLRATLTVEI